MIIKMKRKQVKERGIMRFGCLRGLCGGKRWLFWAVAAGVAYVLMGDRGRDAWRRYDRSIRLENTSGPPAESNYQDQRTFYGSSEGNVTQGISQSLRDGQSLRLDSVDGDTTRQTNQRDRLVSNQSPASIVQGVSDETQSGATITTDGDGGIQSVKPVKMKKAEEALIARSMAMGYEDMLKSLKIYIYPYTKKEMPLTHKEFSHLKMKYRNMATKFRNPPKGGTYASIGVEANTMRFEYFGTFGSGGYFVKTLKRSPFITRNPEKATFFLMPIACDGMRYAANSRLGGGWLAEAGMAFYLEQIKHMYPYWNRTQGADHFYICTHIGPTVAASADPNMVTKAIAVVCAGDVQNPYFVPQKDIVIPPSVQPPPSYDPNWYTPESKDMLAMFAGDMTKGRVRQQLKDLYLNDTNMLVRPKLSHIEYGETMARSKFCLVPRGTKVNTPRINEAVWYGCVPVIISDFYHLPFMGILDWSKFSVTIPEVKLPQLKSILQSIPPQKYARMLRELEGVRTALAYSPGRLQPHDAFHNILLSLWQRRHFSRYHEPVIGPLDTVPYNPNQ